MERRRLGGTGLEVSSLALGTMTWARDTDVHEARDQLGIFLDAGGTLVDTADVYADGESERIVGTLVAEAGRDAVVLATKAGARPGPGRRVDTSRAHLLRALDASLARLGTDHVDLWQVHRWDPDTPLEETVDTLAHAVRSGRVRYVGLSNFSGWQTAATAALLRTAGVPLAAVQVEYSLLARGAEREVLPASRAFEAGVLPWSPLGRGVLTGKYRFGTPADSRGASAHFAGFVTPYLEPGPRRIVEAVCTAAEGLGVPPLDVALAWVRDRPGVVSPVVGARTAAQLRELLQADLLGLPEEITVALDEVSRPGTGYPDALAQD